MSHMDLPFGLGFGQIILIIGVVLVISFIFFRRYFSALVYDYVVDGGLSFADTFIGTLPVGDALAAFLIYKKEKKIVGLWVIIPTLEAANFIIGAVPVVGQPIEIVTNLTPAVFLTRLLFNKYRPAEKKEKKLEKDISLAEKLGVNTRGAKKVSKEVKRKIKKANPVGALKELKSKKADEKIRSELRDYANEWISATNNIIQGISNQNIQATILQQGVAAARRSLYEAQSALQTKRKEEVAINSAINAYNIIKSAVEQYQAELQNQQSQRGNA